ncbi:CST complex subunit STN1 [Glycine max]|nr:hypothetical protein JHK86_033864 [Glycine max]KAH1221498.1 CST complex subunit STN1 [Glycine max]
MTLLYCKGIPISFMEIVGSIMLWNLKHDQFLCFAVDDGTNCILLLSLNDANSSSVACRHHHDHAMRFASLVKLDIVAIVKGMLSCFRGAVQVTMSNVVVERNPNAEIFHCLNCILLTHNCYNVFPGWGIDGVMGPVQVSGKRPWQQRE